VAITALVGVLLVVYGFLGHPVLIGVGFVLVAVPVLGTWIWWRHVHRVARERASQEALDWLSGDPSDADR
jgi:Flp pilus assembly protein TadB